MIDLFEGRAGIREAMVGVYGEYREPAVF